MKKYLYIHVLTLSILSNLAAREQREYYGKSYVRSLPLFQIASPEMPTYRDNKDKEHNLDVVVFGGSTGKSKRLAAYFSPTGNQPLVVSENDDRTTVEDFDLLSPDFGIITDGTYRSSISFKPEETRIGVGLSYYYRFWATDDNTRYSYIHVSMPIEHVKHDMHFCENKETGSEAFTMFTKAFNTPIEPQEIKLTFASMTEALQQSDWCFGKIRTCGDSTSTGVADISARIAGVWQPDETVATHLYAGVLIPTGDKVKSKYLFEPIVGHGRHFGAMWGAQVHGLIWDCQDRNMQLSLDIISHGLYLFSKTQQRSCDLKQNGRWSRYLDMYKNQIQAAEAAAFGAAGGNAGNYLSTPGINLLTRDVHVKPGFSYTINGWLSAEWNYVIAKLGYVVYAQSNEDVRLCTVPKDFAIKAFEGNGKTQPLRSIDAKHNQCPQVDLADYQTAFITEQDLDLSVASSPAALHSSLFGSVAYEKDCWRGSFGASYTFKGSSNAVPQRWAAWVSFGYDI